MEKYLKTALAISAFMILAVPVLALAQDTDRDRIVDSQEYLYGTSPYIADFDNDGAMDGLELAYESDPLDPGSLPDCCGGHALDEDYDALSYDEEIEAGTLPGVWDTDGDNFGDAMEIAYGGDPLDPEIQPECCGGHNEPPNPI